MPPSPLSLLHSCARRAAQAQQLILFLGVLLRVASRSRSITPDAERLEKLISELQGKDINELIAEGTSKLASVPSGGAAASAAPAAGGAAPAAAAEAEKPKEEEKEESDDDMG